MADISASSLDGYVGMSIGEICSNNFDDAHQNHCAHFVSHALDLQLGMLCGDMKFETKKTGASIRCDEVYNKLSKKGGWADRPQQDGILIFVTSAKNVKNNLMLNVPQKHVGIFHSGKVYNFSNSKHMVVCDNTVEAFHKKFKSIYHGGDISLFYGVP